MTDNTAGVGPVEREVRPLAERLRAYPADPLLCDDYSTAMLEAADELDQLMQTLRDEMDENLRLRELGGAGPEENITAMTERLIQERSAVRMALQEADTIMGHDDAATEWREKWAGLWPNA